MMPYIREFAAQVQLYDTGLTRVRLGQQGDGGYVVIREPLVLVPELWSYGVGDDVSFELDLLTQAENCQRVILYDPTINELPQQHKRFEFRQEFADVYERFGKNAVVKMDIEGDEWTTLGAMNLAPVSQLVVEFHFAHADPPQGSSLYFHAHFRRLLREENEMRWRRYMWLLRTLNKGFYCHHAHINNSLPLHDVDGASFPLLLELSYIRKDLAPGAHRVHRIISGIKGLDFPNKTDRPDRWWDATTCKGGDCVLD